MTKSGALETNWQRAHFFFVLVCIAIFLVNFVPRLNGFHILDDSYMFSRYADHFLEHGYFTWNGESGTYGATSLLYVIVLIPFRLITPDNPALSLFLASFTFGVLFVMAIFRLTQKELRYPDKFKLLVSGLIWLGFATSSRSFAAHFASGMDTTMAMFYGAVFLIGMKRVERSASLQPLVWVGILAGMAWWIRPDLLVLTLGIPFFLILFSPAESRRKYLILTGIAGISLIAWWGLAVWMTGGHLLPHSFIAKSTDLYGATFADVYKWLSAIEYAKFLSRNWPFWVMIGLTFWFNTQLKSARFTALEKAIFITGILFSIYHLFFVIPVMGFAQRFLYPMLPFVILVAARGTLNLRDHLRAYTGADLIKVLPNADRIIVAISGGILIYYGITGAMRLKESNINEEFFTWNATETYQQRLDDYWYRLDKFSGLPDDLVIATSEVGLPAALNPHKKIVDLAGLNSPELLTQQGITADDILDLHRPDLLYMPVGHYAKLHASFAASAQFKQDYFLMDAQEIGCAFGVAFRKDSPHLGAMLEIGKINAQP